MAKPRWEIPAPNYDRDVNTVVSIYRNAIRQVLIILSELSTHGQADKTISKAHMNSVMNQISVLLSEVDRDAESFIREEIEKAFIDGQAETIVSIGDAESLREARSAVSMSALSRDTIEAMVADTFEDLLYANQKMKRETIKMVRQVVAEQMKTTSAMGQGVNFTKKMIKEAFEEQGNVAIIDRAGRRWKLDTYAEVVTRTKMLQAHAEGTRIESLERGIDLAIISRHGAKDDCRKFEGQIISMNGLTPGFMTYDELRRSNLIFHPNCRHKVTPIRDINRLPQAVRDRIEKGKGEAQKALKERKRRK